MIAIIPPGVLRIPRQSLVKMLLGDAGGRMDGNDVDVHLRSQRRSAGTVGHHVRQNIRRYGTVEDQGREPIPRVVVSVAAVGIQHRFATFPPVGVLVVERIGRERLRLQPSASVVHVEPTDEAGEPSVVAGVVVVRQPIAGSSPRGFGSFQLPHPDRLQQGHLRLQLLNELEVAGVAPPPVLPDEPDDHRHFLVLPVVHPRGRHGGGDEGVVYPRQKGIAVGIVVHGKHPRDPVAAVQAVAGSRVGAVVATRPVVRHAFETRLLQVPGGDGPDGEGAGGGDIPRSRGLEIGGQDRRVWVGRGIFLRRGFLQVSHHRS
mmetsp:Transcript_33032/g.76126  ORF Transcript_33032/g.76126 Transcript_33032/m.76126 type:complete len:317 (-) Transcript_33032:365-1315(-)